MKNKRLIILLSAAIALLLIPLLAMLFSSSVNWSPFDFLVMGALLCSTALAIEWVLRLTPHVKSRMLISAVVLLVFFLIWAELAVGIFGSPFAGS